jgi:hypothetical protein
LLFPSLVLAEQAQRRVTFGGATFALTVLNGGLEISYLEPPAMLREIGVTSGTLLARGRWRGETLEGDAFVFGQGCSPIAYPIRGVIESGGALVIIGPVPSETKDCQITALDWNDEAVMRFKPVGREKLSRPKPKPEAKSKPAAKPKPKPKPKPRPVPQQPQWQQWPWQWR